MHFFTTDPGGSDADIIAQGKYQEDLNYYSKVLPLSVQRVSPESLQTIYRWELKASDGHYFGTDPNDPPPDPQASEGSKFMAFNAPSDPFSQSSLLVGEEGLLGVIQVNLSLQARNTLNTLLPINRGSAYTSINRAISVNANLQTQANQYQGNTLCIVPVEANHVLNVRVRVTALVHNPPHPATQAATVEVVNITLM
ncbi:MAG: hypothetical protein MN733_37230 [Nitrososphaera sp.]|nr:hypothetical protein [Nitrososphaera sp.]